MSVLEREILLTVVEELLLKSNTELLDGKKRQNWVISDSFSSSFHLKPPIYTSRIHILQKKSTQIPHHGLWEGSNILDRAREGCHRLLSWQIQRSQWAIQVGWVGQFTTRDPPPLHGKCHLKFPFWFSAPFPKKISCGTSISNSTLHTYVVTFSPGHIRPE